MASSSKPEHTVKVGGIQLSIWANDTGKGVFHSITIDKSYKDGDTWKRTKSFKPTDLMKVQIGIAEVFKYLYVKDVITPEVAGSRGTSPQTDGSDTPQF